MEMNADFFYENFKNDANVIEENIKDAILSIYGSRYKETEYKKLKSMIDNTYKCPNLNSNYSK